MKMAIIMLVVCLNGCAHQDAWTTRDTVMQIAVAATMAYDAHLTSQIQHYPGVYERGPVARAVLGSKPKTSDTYLYFGTVMATSYLVSRALPAKWRPYWQVYGIADHAYAAGTLCDRGLC